MNSNYFRTMLSISKNEFNVIGFLIRNFSKKFTIRNIASKIGVSAAGAHAVLKKLEGNSVVKAERLGTGLFYEINLDNNVAKYLAAISLLKYCDVSGNFEELKESKAVVFDGKSLLVISNDIDSVKDICYDKFKELKLVCKSEEEFTEALKGKREVLEILEQGNVIFGEEVVIDCIKRII